MPSQPVQRHLEIPEAIAAARADAQLTFLKTLLETVEPDTTLGKLFETLGITVSHEDGDKQTANALLDMIRVDMIRIDGKRIRRKKRAKKKTAARAKKTAKKRSARKAASNKNGETKPPHRRSTAEQTELTDG